MISSFSSYLEFLAAIYTSMYFDRVLDFRSPKYKSNLNEALEKNNWTKDTLFSTNLKKACSEWYNGVRKSMLNKAAFMILSIVAILIFAGFEDSIDDSFKNTYYSSFVFTWIVVFLFILVAFRRFFFSKVKTMFLALLMEVALFFVSLKYIVPALPETCNLYDYTQITLLLFSLLPLAIQILSSWLSSTPYSKYIEKRLPSFKKEYDVAQISLKTRDVSLVNDEFKEVITAMFVQGETSDTSMQKYQELLRKKMLTTCQPKTISVILWSWIVFQWEYFIRKLFKRQQVEIEEIEEEAVYEMPLQFRPQQANVNYADEYKKYRAEKELDWKLNIRDYCKKHNISPSAMISWVKENKPSVKETK